MPERSTRIVRGIDCIYLPATDTKTSAAWYAGFLGLELLRPVDENQAQLGIGFEQSIFLIRTKEPTNLVYTEIGGTEQCVLTLEVANLTDLHAKMKAQGAIVSEIGDNGDCGCNFSAWDPAGNKIDLWSGWPQ